MQTFILAAEQVGLGCCPISVIRKHLLRVCEILGLPERVVPVAGLCVGYPAGDGHISMRLPPALTRHVDRYDDTDLARELDDYDRRRAKVAPIAREKQRAPDKFGYAGFTDGRRTNPARLPSAKAKLSAPWCAAAASRWISPRRLLRHKHLP
jgi:nitroreductase/FMN reductase [NAD(P)H]